MHAVHLNDERLGLESRTRQQPDEDFEAQRGRPQMRNDEHVRHRDGQRRHDGQIVPGFGETLKRQLNVL